jgi:outer membrane protein assembly factor BamB
MLMRYLILALLLAQWPQFRGPDGNGVTAATGLPLRWSETENVRWKTPIHGKAWSSPIVLGDRVWMTTATPDGRELFVVAVDKASGRVVLDQKLFDVPNPQFAHAFNSYASPTPVGEPRTSNLEPARVYVTFGSPGTAALDAASGKVLWTRRDLECNHFRGAGSSPIVFRDLLVMHFDGSDVQYIVALDKRTGKTVWKTPRSIDFQDVENGKIKADGDFRKAFSTPQIVTVDGRPVLISPGSKATYAYDPATGKELWRIVERSSFSASNRPVTGHGLVYYTTGWNTGSVMAVRPDGRGDVSDSHVALRSPRGAPQKPSLLLLGDLLFMVNDTGIVTCLDAKTGVEVWHARMPDSYSASPIAAEGRIYFFSEDGKTTVIEAGRAFKVLAESTLDDGFMASAAVDGRAFYLRTKSALYRIESR